MIGFYDYTVVVTYISLVSSILGMFCAIDGKLTLAVSCLAFSGLCDMFDGKIARTKKNRTDDEKSFGIQIDSLCDIVCFGIFPIILGYKLGMCKAYSIAILAFYGMAGVIRLAYFNVMEQNARARHLRTASTIRTSDHIYGCDHAASVCGIGIFSGISLFCGIASCSDADRRILVYF